MPNEVKTLPLSSIVEVSYSPRPDSYLRSKTKAGEKKPTITIEEIKTRFTTLKEAKRRLSIAYLQYVRRLVKDGKLEGMKVKVGAGERWLVTTEAIERYEAKRKDHGTKRNYLLRIEPEGEATLRKLLKDNGIEFSLELAYVSKPKATTPAEDIWARVIDSID